VSSLKKAQEDFLRLCGLTKRAAAESGSILRRRPEIRDYQGQHVKRFNAHPHTPFIASRTPVRDKEKGWNFSRTYVKDLLIIAKYRTRVKFIKTKVLRKSN
jgi:hypothetical protein